MFITGSQLAAFLRHSGHMAQATLLGYLDSEKWLDIQGFTNFTATHFFEKCHTVNSSQNSHLYLLHLGQYSFSHYPRRFMTTGEDREKQRPI